MIVQLSGEYSPHMNFNAIHGHAAFTKMYRNTS